MSHPYGPPQQPPGGGYGPPGGGYPPPPGGPQPPYRPGPGGYGPPPPPPPHRAPKKHTGLKVTAGILAALVVLITIGTLLGGGDDPGGSGRERLELADDASTSSPRTSAAEEEQATSPTAAPTPTAEATPAARARTYRGRGDKVVKVAETDDVLLVSMTHTGGSNFIVHPIDPGGAEQASIVNEIGSYKGTVLVNEEDGKVLRGFTVKADGAWTLTLKPLTMARAWAGTRVAGRGDDVLMVVPASSGLVTVKAEHSGSSNFVIYAYSERDRNLLVNEIGSYRGQLLLADGTILVTVKADGRWTLTREEE